MDEEMSRQMERQTACQTWAATDCCSIDHVIGQYIALSETLSTTIRLSQAVYKNRKGPQLIYSIQECSSSQHKHSYPYIQD